MDSTRKLWNERVTIVAPGFAKDGATGRVVLKYRDDQWVVQLDDQPSDEAGGRTFASEDQLQLTN